MYDYFGTKRRINKWLKNGPEWFRAAYDNDITVNSAVRRCAESKLTQMQMLWELSRVQNALFIASVELNFKEKKVQWPANKDVDL